MSTAAKKTGIMVLTLSFAIIPTYFVMRYLLALSPQLLTKFFGVVSIQGLDNKLTVLFTTMYYIAIYLLVVSCGIMSYRLPSGKNPVNSNKDPKWVVCLNRIIYNTIEQSFVFFPVYLYWLHVLNIDDSRLSEALVYPLMFLVGRVLFAVGYLTGSFLNLLQLRSVGFAMNMIVSTSLIMESQGFNLIKKIYG